MNENLIGRTIQNRYHISELIGTGGMASVFKGEDELLKRDVAIKVLKDSVKEDESALEKFNQEAQAAAGLSHKNIVSVYDFGEEDGIDYMVMEYVKGETLKKYIRDNGPLPWQEACDYAIQICQALDAAHSSNIIHRDIKPQNILMTEDKELKVTDFGIAKATTTETLSVGDNSAMGSVHYISPEQARGGHTDARSDIYSLGIVLFEMLTGSVPFDGDSAVSIALMHIEKEAPDVSMINPSIPSDLARIVAKAIAKEQILRYQNIGEMLTDLHAVLANRPIVDGKDYLENDDEELGNTKKFNIDDGFEEVKTKKQKLKKTPEQKKADKAATILAIITVIVLMVGTFVVWRLFKANSGEAPAPDFTGMLLEEAVDLAEEKGFKISEDLEYSLSDDVDEGKVISQLPTPNTYISKSEEIHLVVSIGSSGGSIAVPYIKGLTVEEAIEKIIASELTYLINEEPNDAVPAGNVIRQSPEVGTKLNPDDVVTIHVSTGKQNTEEATPIPEQVIVPSLYNLTKDDAERECISWGLKLVSVSKKDSAVPAGQVISQSPEAGRKVMSGTAVSIVISTGAAPEGSSDYVAPTVAPVKVDKDTNEEEKNTSAKKTKTFSFTVPGEDGSSEVKITVDGDTIFEKTKKAGDVVSIDITEKGEKKVVLFIDGKIVDQQIIDFD